MKKNIHIKERFSKKPIQRFKFFLCILSSLSLPLVCLSAYSQDTEKVYIEVSQCLPLQNNEQKFACFESATENFIGKTNSDLNINQSLLDLPKTSIESPPYTQNIDNSSTNSISNELDDFGTDISNSKIIENPNSGNKELIDYISSLQEREPGKFLITLSSGHVWYQMHSKRYRLRKGMEIKIYRSPLGGSYRLSSPTLTGYIQVRRID